MARNPSFGIDDIVNFVQGNRRTLSGRGPYAEGSRASNLVQKGLAGPARLVGEFSGAADVYRGVRPGASVGQKAMGLASLAAPLAAREEVFSAAAKGVGATKRSLASKMYEKVKPRVNMENYILHGGPEAKNLVGGVVNPQFVRGGSRLSEVNTTRSMEPSIVDLNALEDVSIVEKNRPGDAEIIRRIKAGEQHSTGVSRYDPELAYASSGAVHVLNVPPNLKTTAPIAPAGEIKFWGEHKPVASIPGNIGEAEIKRQVMQSIIDAENARSGRIAPTLARAAGIETSPAYQQYILDMFDKRFNKQVYPMMKNPQYGVDPKEILPYITDYSSPQVPMISNYQDVVEAVSRAKNKDELARALRSAVPAENIDYGSFSSGLNSIVSDALGLRSGYGRLRK